MADAVPSDERADKTRRPASPVPSGAGGGRHRAVLASLERQSSLPAVGRLALLARRSARGRTLFRDQPLVEDDLPGGAEAILKGNPGDEARPLDLHSELGMIG